MEQQHFPSAREEQSGILVGNNKRMDKITSRGRNKHSKSDSSKNKEVNDQWQLDNTGSSSMTRPSNDNRGLDLVQGITGMAFQFTDVFATAENSGLQGAHGNRDPESGQVLHEGTENMIDKHLPKALFTMSFAIMSTATATAVNKPASGEIFRHNKLAYYITLGALFGSGAAGFLTAYWVEHSRRYSFGRVALLILVIPLVLVIGISGFAYIG